MVSCRWMPAGKVLAPAEAVVRHQHRRRECDEIMAAAGGAARCIELAGNPILAGYTASKLPWTRKHRPEAYAALATILLPHDYVNFWLTGERWMEHGDASGTGWLDVRTRDWSGRHAARPPIRIAIWPPACRRWSPPTQLSHRTAIAAELGLPRDVRIAAGGGDNMMAAIGTGNVAPGMLSMSLGTSGTLFACADHPLVDHEGRLGRLLLLHGRLAAADLHHELHRGHRNRGARLRLQQPRRRRRDGRHAARRRWPGACCPSSMANARPTCRRRAAVSTASTSSNFTRGNAYRAAMEGATYALRNGFDALRAAGLAFDAIRLTGGGSHSAVWRQMVADVFELPVEVPDAGRGRRVRRRAAGAVGLRDRRQRSLSSSPSRASM